MMRHTQAEQGDRRIDEKATEEEEGGGEHLYQGQTEKLTQQGEMETTGKRKRRVRELKSHGAFFRSFALHARTANVSFASFPLTPREREKRAKLMGETLS